MPTPRQREGAERLRLLYSLIPGLPRENFKMAAWRMDGSLNDTVSDACLLRGAAKHDCGTTACAVGWAGVHPQFREWGLRFDRDGMRFDGPEYGHSRDEWRGVEILFRLAREPAHYIFRAAPACYPGLAYIPTSRVRVVRNLMFPLHALGDTGSTDKYHDDRHAVMVRILTHLYLRQHIGVRRLKAAFAKIKTECDTLPVRT